jgi:2-Cys peroxiredoxin 5
MELKSAALIRTAKQEFACELRDLSERGARIGIGGRTVPERFELMLGGGSVPRLAQVCWTRGNEIGVQFVPRGRGHALPDLQLTNSEGKIISLSALVSERRSVLVGVVGAFAPDRYQTHAAEIVERAQELKRSGFARLICVAPNDPWTVKAWAGVFDPERRLTFLSDGNLDLARWLGATFVSSRKRQLGVRSRSYLALLREGTIEKLTVNDIAANLVFNERPEVRNSELGSEAF